MEECDFYEYLHPLVGNESFRFLTASRVGSQDLIIPLSQS
jgi:hypothetical protein